MQTLVILHGWSLLADRAEELLQELRKHYLISLPRMPGYGGLPDTPSAESMDFLLDELHETLARQGVQNCHLLGFSMGAQISVHFAQRYPDMVERLVLIGARPPEKQWHWLNLLARLPELARAIRLMSWLEYGIVDWAFAQARKLTPGKEIQHFRPGDASLHGAYDSLVAQAGRYLNPFETKQPTLYVYGELDRMRPKDIPPGKTVEIVPGVGHNALMAGGRGLAKKITQFLE